MSVDAQSALHNLLTGNQRFASGSPNDPNVSPDRRAELTHGQTPFATVLGCVDSRAPIELIFDVSVGDLLTVRSAGQALRGAPLGNVEFGVRVLGTELVAVVGHSSCGAVASASHPERSTGPLGELIAEVADRLVAVSNDDPVRANLVASVEELRADATLTLPDGRTPIVVGMLYDLASGVVELVDDGGLSVE